jgi:hypothetical protein
LPHPGPPVTIHLFIQASQAPGWVPDKKKFD